MTTVLPTSPPAASPPRSQRRVQVLMGSLAACLGLVLLDPWPTSPEMTPATGRADALASQHRANSTHTSKESASAPMAESSKPSARESSPSRARSTAGSRPMIDEKAFDILNPQPSAVLADASSATAQSTSGKRRQANRPQVTPVASSPPVFEPPPQLTAQTSIAPSPAPIRFAYPVIGAWQQATSLYAVIQHPRGTLLLTPGTVFEGQWQVAGVTTQKVELVHVPTQMRQIVQLQDATR